MVSRSGEIDRPCSTVSSPVLTIAATSAGATTSRSPRRKRAAPTPPETTATRGDSDSFMRAQHARRSVGSWRSGSLSLEGHAARVHHWDHWPGRSAPGRVPAWAGLRRVRDGQGPEQPEGRRGGGCDAVRRAGAGGSGRSAVIGGGVGDGPARRGLQPRGDQLRGAVVLPGRADGEHDRVGRAADVGGDPHDRWHPEQPDPLLSGVVVGDVRQGARVPAERADAVPPALAVRVRQGRSGTTSR